MKIGDREIRFPLLLAPMAGLTGPPLRLLARRHGADVVFTEMVSAAGLIRNPARTSPYLTHRDEERPIGVQIFGADPWEMARAAEVLSEGGFDLIDINMGCPVRKVVRSGAGAALLRDLPRARAVIRAVVRATALPVTVKMRSGWDKDHVVAADLAVAAEKEGVSAVILHPRTRTQGLGGRADWGVIRAVKEAVDLPVIGNGDVRNPSDALRMRAETGCDGIMIGRAALGAPWIFETLRAALDAGTPPARPDAGTVRRTLLLHLDLEIAGSGEKRAVPRMRKFAAWYSRGLPGAATFRDRINGVTRAEDFVAAVDALFRTGEPAPLATGEAP